MENSLVRKGNSLPPLDWIDWTLVWKFLSTMLRKLKKVHPYFWENRFIYTQWNHQLSIENTLHQCWKQLVKSINQHIEKQNGTRNMLMFKR